MKKTLALGAVALALAGCAGTYYQDGYGSAYEPYYYDNGYGAPSYYGPGVGLGYYYYDNNGHRQWRDGDRHDSGRQWNNDRGDHGDRGDRGGRDWNRGGTGDPRSFHGESGNEAGSGYSQQ